MACSVVPGQVWSSTTKNMERCSRSISSSSRLISSHRSMSRDASSRPVFSAIVCALDPSPAKVSANGSGTARSG